MKTVYLVVLEGKTEEEIIHEIDVYSNRTAALLAYYNKISDEKDPETSWVGSQAIAEDGSVNDDYTLTEETDYGDNDLYWKVSDDYTSRYTCISLVKEEVKDQ